MGPIQDLARDLNAEERTLRRAVRQGTLRAKRSGPRRLRLNHGEAEYLDGHWGLLADLRRALRTERRVRLAVLYGSLARGDEDPDSDLDLLVSFDRDPKGVDLPARLQQVSGRRVDIADLDRIEKDAPILLARILEEGRVLADRDCIWPQLRERRRAIQARARRAHARQMAAAAQAIRELVDG